VTFLAFVAASLAAQVELEVQPRQLEVGQTVDVQLTVTDGSVRGTPEVPVDDGLTIAFGGQSSQHIIVNFHQTRSVVYQYELTAMRQGTFQVGPVSLVVDGQTMTAEPVTVKVSPRSGRQVGRAGDVSDAAPGWARVVLYRFEAQYDQRTA
jgi:uncharacterized protein (DUF58 family)